MKKVSLRDIAEELGVSKTLVSLVLNGKAEENRISPEVIEKVKKVAKEKGYEPNAFAKALRTGRSHTIGLIVADISNAFFAKMARSIEDQAYHTDYTVLFGSSDEDHEKASKLIKAMLDRQIEGLIISPTLGGSKNIELIKKYKIPYVLVDRMIPGISGTCVSVDNFQASFAAVSGMITDGCKKIVHITFNHELSNLHDRMIGYESAHEEHGLTSNPELITHLSSDHAEKEIISYMETIKDKADGYFFTNNEIGLVAIKYLLQSGIIPGKDVLVTCFDDHEAFYMLNGSVRVITQPVIEIGEKALELMLSQIKGKGNGPQEIVLKTDYRVTNEHLVKEW